MGSKKVCFKCRKTFSIRLDIKSTFSSTCPECNGQTTIFNHKFKPPTKNDIRKWKVVEFLKDHGFIFQHVYKDMNKINGSVSNQNYVEYPIKLDEAKDFVIKYKAQAYYLLLTADSIQN